MGLRLSLPTEGDLSDGERSVDGTDGAKSGITFHFFRFIPSTHRSAIRGSPERKGSAFAVRQRGLCSRTSESLISLAVFLFSFFSCFFQEAR